jgi:predicted DNA-binding transcriptional regulator YafY
MPGDGHAEGGTEEAQSAARKRLAAERLKRIWELVEQIAREPGHTRRQLAAHFRVSERQLQDDLDVVRREIGLPLVRRRGYRFLVSERDTPPVFTLAEAQLLLMVLRRAARDPSLPGDRLRSLLEKLPDLFPAHLRPLVARTLETATAERWGRQPPAVMAVAEALLNKTYVKLHYPAGEAVSFTEEPVVQPEVLLPYRDSWYVVGPNRERRRTMVFDLERVVAVTQAGLE